MKILLLTHKTPFPPNDGGTLATYHMIQGLQQAGAQVDVLCMRTPKHASLLADFPAEILQGVRWHQVFVDTRLRWQAALRNLLFSEKPYNAERFVSQAFADKLRDLSTESYDLVQLEGLYLAPYLPLIRQLYPARVVMRSHNVEHQIWERMVQQEQNLLKKWYKKGIQRRVRRMELASLQQIDALVPISAVDAAYFKSYTQVPLKVSITGMPEQKFKNRQEGRPHTLFFLGALDWEPNLEGLLWFVREVWPAVKMSLPQLSFHVAGRQAPNGLAEQLSAAGIVFHGEVPDAQSFMDQYQVLIVPLFSGSGVRIKIIEAMARGKAVLTTSVGAEGLDVQSGEQLVIADSVENMLQQLVQWEQQDGERQHVASQGYAFAEEHFNNLENCRSLLQFYQSLKANE